MFPQDDGLLPHSANPVSVNAKIPARILQFPAGILLTTILKFP